MHEHYNPDGELTGTTVVTRPGWNDTDRAYALELAWLEANECGRCGGDLRETLDKRWRWVPSPLPHVCGRCAAFRQAERTHKDDPRAGAMLHVVSKVENPFWQQPSEVDSAL